MIEELLSRDEGKTLEFKENTQSLKGIIKTIIAFSNTAGGFIVIGVKDRLKEIVGVENVLDEEERIANSVAASIEPLIRPDIEIHTYRNKQIIVIRVYHGAGPYYLKSDGLEKGVYIRFGSTNRVADADTVKNLSLLSRNISFDELPYIHGSKKSLDWPVIKKLFEKVQKTITEKKCMDMGMLVENGEAICPSNGGIILFGKERRKIFPDAIIRCARFAGIEKVNFLDQKVIDAYLPLALDEAIAFIDKHITVRSVIGKTRRIDIPQYPHEAIREALINALVHTDYAMRGATITIALFDDRIEITNPGGLPFGMTLEHALTGSSRIRNHVIAQVFSKLNLIEQWGTGIKRIKDSCREQGLQVPTFQEIGNQFKVTLFSTPAAKVIIKQWQQRLIEYLKLHEQISTKEAAALWGVTIRSARQRLKNMGDQEFIAKIATAPKDPYAVYILKSEKPA